MSRQNANQPSFWIVAGPNGSGKTSAYSFSDFEESFRSVWIINPDMLSLRIVETEGLELGDANLEAVNRIEAWLETSILTHQTIGVETVLSTGKYRRLVEKAKSLGFRIKLIYVVLDRPERNIERVKLRVSKGGHSVPENKIVDRYLRSLQQMPWFLDNADEALIYDNSGATPVRVAEKVDGVITVFEDAPKNLKDAISTLDT